MGRLDHLVEAVYDRFKDRYFDDESALFKCPSIPPFLLTPVVVTNSGVIVDISGTK